MGTQCLLAKPGHHKFLVHLALQVVIRIQLGHGADILYVLTV